MKARTLTGVVVGLMACAPGLAAQAPVGGAPLDVARALVDAFNRHDPGAMAAMATDDFELYYVGDDGVSVLATRGATGLRDDMAEYFATRPSVRSSVTGSIGGTRFVAFREQIVGGESSLAVYEIEEGRVRRAWYYPAEPGG